MQSQESALVRRLAREAGIAAREEDRKRRRQNSSLSSRAKRENVGMAVASALTTARQQAPLVPPVATPRPFNFLEENWSSEDLVIDDYPDTRYQPIDNLAGVTWLKTMRVTYRQVEGSGKTDEIIPIPFDGVDGFYQRMQDEEIMIKGEPYKVYSCAAYEPFTEMGRRIGEKTQQRLDLLCPTCAPTMHLCMELKVLGTYWLGNLIGRRVHVIARNLQEHPCTCGMHVVNRALGILAALIDGLLR